MENATDALKLAFAVLVLVLALAVCMNMYNRALEVSDMIIAQVGSYDYGDFVEFELKGHTGQCRIVGFETVIPTLYRYDKERFTVQFYEATSYNEVTGEFVGLKPMYIYKTLTNYKNWATVKDLSDPTGASDTIKYPNYFPADEITKSPTNKGISEYIYRFDVVEESAGRHECWTGTPEEIKKHLDAIISATRYYDPNYNDAYHYIDYGSSSSGDSQFKKLIVNNARFVEMVGKYQTKEKANNKIGTKTTTKTVITYVKVDSVINTTP